MGDLLLWLGDLLGDLLQLLGELLVVLQVLDLDWALCK